MPHLLSDRLVVARKPHHCMHCGDVAVRPGDKYIREVCVHDGHIYNVVVCSGCAALTSDVQDWWGDPDEGISADEIRTWADEHPEDPRATAYWARCRNAADAATARAVRS